MCGLGIETFDAFCFVWVWMSSMYARVCLALWFGGDIASVHECITTIKNNLFCYVLWLLTSVGGGGVWLTRCKVQFFNRNLDRYKQVLLLGFLEDPLRNWTNNLKLWVKNYDKNKNQRSKFPSCFLPHGKKD